MMCVCESFYVFIYLLALKYYTYDYLRNPMICNLKKYSQMHRAPYLAALARFSEKKIQDSSGLNNITTSKFFPENFVITKTFKYFQALEIEAICTIFIFQNNRFVIAILNHVDILKYKQINF